MIPQPYPLWIRTADDNAKLLVIGWITNEAEDDLVPVVIHEDRTEPGMPFSFPHPFYLISPEAP